MQIPIAAVVTVLFLLLSPGCVTDPRGASQPATLTRGASNAVALTLTQQTTLKLPPGLRARPLPAGSTWDQVGSIQQGNDFRLRDGVFVVDAGHRHEAFLTVADGHIVGLYLPFKHLMVPVSPPVPVNPLLETKP